MPHDAFISYSSKDKPTADAVCAKLESKNIRCWIAPRDVAAGQNWGQSIVGAIKNAQVMVLVFSAHANISPQVVRELERAASRGLPIIPFRIEDVKPASALEFYISTAHWLNALTPPLEAHLEKLAQMVLRILGGWSGETEADPPLEEPDLPEPEAATQRRDDGALPKLKGTTSVFQQIVSGLGLLVLLILLIIVGFIVWEAASHWQDFLGFWREYWQDFSVYYHWR